MTIALDPVRMVRDIDLVSSWLDPFAGLRRDYGVIYADPPWSFATYSAKGRDRCPDAVGSDGGPRHYDLMTIDELKDLPVASLAGPNCKLVLWTTAEISHAPSRSVKHGVSNTPRSRSSGRSCCRRSSRVRSGRRPGKTPISSSARATARGRTVNCPSCFADPAAR